METGTIKTIVEGKPFGFIAREGQPKDIFFHKDQVTGMAFEDLKVGDMVSFTIVETERGPAAQGVTLAGK